MKEKILIFIKLFARNLDQRENVRKTLHLHQTVTRNLDQNLDLNYTEEKKPRSPRFAPSLTLLIVASLGIHLERHFDISYALMYYFWWIEHKRICVINSLSRIKTYKTHNQMRIMFISLNNNVIRWYCSLVDNFSTENISICLRCS